MTEPAPPTYQPDPETVARLAGEILRSQIGAIIDIGFADISEYCVEEFTAIFAGLPEGEACAAEDALLDAVSEAIKTNPVIASQQGHLPAIGSISPTDPDKLGQWLRSVPGAILADRDGHAAEVTTGIETQEGRVLLEFPALANTAYFGRQDISDGSNNLIGLAMTEAPYTLLAHGRPTGEAQA